MSNTNSPTKSAGLKRILLRSVAGAAGIAVAALLMTAPAGATPAKDICKQMNGKFSSGKDSKGNVNESCSVDSGGGAVVGSWENGQWQGTIGVNEDLTKPGPGHTYVPLNSPHPQ